jgi:hypothetical protein
MLFMFPGDALWELSTIVSPVPIGLHITPVGVLRSFSFAPGIFRKVYDRHLL